MSNEFVRLVASDVDVIAFFECFIVFKCSKSIRGNCYHFL